MTRYEIHFRSIFRKLKKTPSILKASDLLENSKLTPQDKEDLYAVWWHLIKQQLGI